jgi:hypothetical protein
LPLRLRLRLRLDVLMRNLRLRRQRGLWLLMQNLRLKLSLRLRLRRLMHDLRLRLRLEVMMVRLMGRLAHLLVRLHPWARRRRLDAAEFELHQPVYRIELGPEIFEPRVVLTLQLFDELVELCFLGADLLSQESGPVLQVPANVTHCCPSCMVVVPTTESGLAGSRKTERTLPGRRARQVLQGPGVPRPGGLTASHLITKGGPLSQSAFAAAAARVSGRIACVSNTLPPRAVGGDDRAGLPCG